MCKYFGMLYVRLDEQKGYFGQDWVCLDFATIVMSSYFSSFLTNISGQKALKCHDCRKI
jgi:hypothetical protein